MELSIIFKELLERYPKEFEQNSKTSNPFYKKLKIKLEKALTPLVSEFGLAIKALGGQGLMKKKPYITFLTEGHRTNRGIYPLFSFDIERKVVSLKIGNATENKPPESLVKKIAAKSVTLLPEFNKQTPAGYPLKEYTKEELTDTVLRKDLKKLFQESIKCLKSFDAEIQKYIHPEQEQIVEGEFMTKDQIRQLIDSFLEWYSEDSHRARETVDEYQKFSKKYFTSLSNKEFADAMFNFARHGGRIQSGGYRTAPLLRASIKKNVNKFRKLILSMYDTNFNIEKWWEEANSYNGFGKGIKSIFLHRVFPNRFAIFNNKSRDAFMKIGILSKKKPRGAFDYAWLQEAAEKLISYKPDKLNFYRADAFSHYIIGTKEGKTVFKEICATDGAEAGNRNLSADAIYHPLNQIIYGPPGTGKTYNTINYALSIIEGKTLDEINSQDRTELLKQYNSYKDNGQIEFITFHQSYAYEDFIQGLRPDTKNANGSLSFELKDGIFKIIADSALNNYKASVQAPEGSGGKAPFRKVFESYFKELFEGEVEFVEIKMKKASYKIVEIGEKSILFEKQSGKTDHTLSISSLSNMYDKEAFTLKTKGGLEAYYMPLMNELLKHAKKISKQIAKENLKEYVIIIDEINRANISRVFGELITLIEDDKRYGQTSEMTATLPSGETFCVPPNLHIIGTMNTADKSIALIDIALRRRFEFVKLYPDKELVAKKYKELFNSINNQIVEQKGPDFQIGHAYFMEKQGQEFNLKDVMNKKVIPLLYEYFMNDSDEVNSTLNTAGIKTKNQYGLYEFESYSNKNA